MMLAIEAAVEKCIQSTLPQRSWKGVSRFYKSSDVYLSVSWKKGYFSSETQKSTLENYRWKKLN